MALAGPIGERTQFGEYVHRNIHLHRIRHGVPLSISASANFARYVNCVILCCSCSWFFFLDHYLLHSFTTFVFRTELADFLRQNPFRVDLLFCGVDEARGPQLYWIDYLASMVELDKAAHG